MKRRLRRLLSLAGLREEEATLYLHLLKLRRASMSELIARSGLNVMTAYRTMKRLQDRGLVEALRVNQKQSIYSPMTLRSLTKKLAAEQRNLRKLQLALQDLDPLLPFLDLDREDTGDDSDELIEVREGLDAFREEYLKLPDLCSDEYLSFGSMQNYWNIAGMSDESPEELAFRNKRYRGKIYAIALNTISKESEQFASRDSKELRRTRLLESLPMGKDYIGFTDDRVCHFVCDIAHPKTIIIRHPEVRNLYLQQFQDIWDKGVNA